MTERRELIEATVSDLIKDLLYYDRKDDGELPPGAIEEAIRAGEIASAEIVRLFADHLRDALGEVASRQYVPSHALTVLAAKPSVRVFHELGRDAWAEIRPDGGLSLDGDPARWMVYQNSGAFEAPNWEGS